MIAIIDYGMGNLRSAYMNISKINFVTSIVVILLFCFLIFLIWVLRKVLWALDSPNWPTVTGRVLKSEVSSIILRFRRIYFVDVEYEYSISGIKYSGSYEKLCNSLDHAQTELMQYQVNQGILIYINPNKNKISVLEPGINSVKQLLIFVLGILVGLFLLYTFLPFH